MRLCIVGAGAIGQIYAALLAEAANRSEARQLLLVTRRANARDAVTRGLVLDGPGESRQRRVPVRGALPEEVPDGSQDIVLLAVKTYDTDATMPFVRRVLAPGGVCFSVQNGVANPKRLSEALGEGRAYQGATSFAGSAQEAGRVLITGAGTTWVPADMPHLESLVAWLADAGLNPVVIADTHHLSWHKAAVGTSGTVCVILETPIGQLVRNENVRAIVRAASTEAVAVANACGVPLDVEEVLAQQARIHRSLTVEARASILDDFLAGRDTELDDREGAIVRLGEEKGVPVPVLTTLYRLAQEKFRLRSSTP